MKKRFCLLWIFIYSAIGLFAAKPTVRISASPTSISLGGTSKLTWSSSYATSASIDNGIGAVAVNGSKNVSPAQTTTYTITVKGTGGTTTAKTTVTVKIPPTVTFSASPQSIDINGSSTLTWTTANATSASIDNNIGTVSLNGSKSIKPTKATTYTITVKGAGGTTTAKATVSFNPPNAQMTATPVAISIGQSATLNWTSTNAASASLDNGIGSVAVSGSKVVAPTQTTTYTLTVTGPGGTSTAVALVTVSVKPTVTLAASPISFKPGGSVTLNWASANADSASIDNDIGPVPVTGSLAVSPTKTTTYTITAQGTGGTATASVTVYLTGSRQCLAYVANYDDKTVSVIDADTLTILNTYSYFTHNPRAILFDPEGTFFYSAFDYVDDGVKRLGIGGDGGTAPYIYGHPDYMATNARKNMLYCLGRPRINDSGIPQNVVLITSISTNAEYMGTVRQVTRSLSQGYLKGIAVHPDGSKIYVGNPAENNILILNADKMDVWARDFVPMSDELLGTIPIQNAADLAISPDGSRLYVAHNTHVSTIDTSTNAILSTIEMNQLPASSTPIEPVSLRLSLDGSRLVVARRLDTLSVIDTATNQILFNNVATGLSAISGLAIHPDNSRIYVIGQNSKKMAVLDMATMRPVGNVALGNGPCAVNNFLGYMADIVSGKVTRDGAAQSQVRIDVSGEGLKRVIWTNATGDYVMGFRHGRYTLLPTYQNYAFSPDSLELQVDKTIAGQDFVITGIAPLPLITFTASPMTVLQGDPTTLTWTTTNARKVTFLGNSMPLNGSQKVTPTIAPSQIYEISASGPGGYATASIEIKMTVRPNPVINSFKAIPAVVAPNNKSTLSWTTAYVSTVSIDNGVGSVPVNGSVTVSPNQTTTYRLTAQGRTVITADVTVTVDATLPSVTLSANPQTIIAGNSTTLTWTSTNADSAAIDHGIGAVPVNGSVAVTPLTNTRYTITVTNAKGSSTASADVAVQAAPLPTVQFTADPEVINPPQASTLKWVTTNATQVSIDNGLGNMPLIGSIDVTPTQDTTYTITVIGTGGTVQAQVTVKTLVNHLRGIWNGMKNALSNNNIEQAANFFSEESREKFKDIFTELSGKLSQMANNMTDITPVSAIEDGAQFTIVRKEIRGGKEYNVVYDIFFVKDEDGTWKIYQF